MPRSSPGEDVQSQHQDQVKCRACHSPIWLPAMERGRRGEVEDYVHFPAGGDVWAERTEMRGLIKPGTVEEGFNFNMRVEGEGLRM